MIGVPSRSLRNPAISGTMPPLLATIVRVPVSLGSGIGCLPDLVTVLFELRFAVCAVAAKYNLKPRAAEREIEKAKVRRIARSSGR
jgi:hypothetical protein